MFLTLSRPQRALGSRGFVFGWCRIGRRFEGCNVLTKLRCLRPGWSAVTDGWPESISRAGARELVVIVPDLPQVDTLASRHGLAMGDAAGSVSPLQGPREPVRVPGGGWGRAGR